MGDLLGSPRVAPHFLALFGPYGYYSGLPLVVPIGSALPIAIGAGAIVDPSIRSPDTGRRNRASEISPRFLRHGRSHRLRTIGGNGKLFGRPGGKL